MFPANPVASPANPVARVIPLVGREAGLRLVEVPASEVNNILDIARGCARYPRVRFILVADHLELPLRGTAAADISSALSGSGMSMMLINILQQFVPGSVFFVLVIYHHQQEVLQGCWCFQGHVSGRCCCASGHVHCCCGCSGCWLSYGCRGR